MEPGPEFPSSCSKKIPWGSGERRPQSAGWEERSQGHDSHDSPRQRHGHSPGWGHLGPPAGLTPTRSRRRFCPPRPARSPPREARKPPAPQPRPFPVAAAGHVVPRGRRSATARARPQGRTTPCPVASPGPYLLPVPPAPPAAAGAVPSPSRQQLPAPRPRCHVREDQPRPARRGRGQASRAARPFCPMRGAVPPAPASSSPKMAAAGGPVRLRLLFDHPPPGSPGCALCWLLLEPSQVRLITDLLSLIRHRFGFSRRTHLSLFLDGALLPPTESARLVRDNDSLRYGGDARGGRALRAPSPLPEEPGVSEKGGKSPQGR